jgi:hypothetical protein
MASFSLEQLGLVGGVTANVTVDDLKRLEGDAIRAVAAQALIDGVTSTASGLVVRDIIPDLDLRDAGNQTNGDIAISIRNWVQPTSGGAAVTWLAGEINNDRIQYRTTRNCDDDKKCYVYYGIKRTNVGPASTSTALGVASVTFSRANGSKIVDIWQLEELDAHPMRAVYARTPVLYKRADDQRIAMRPLAKNSGGAEYLMFLGKVAENLGANVTG